MVSLDIHFFFCCFPSRAELLSFFPFLFPFSSSSSKACITRHPGGRISRHNCAAPSAVRSGNAILPRMMVRGGSSSGSSLGMASSSGWKSFFRSRRSRHSGSQLRGMDPSQRTRISHTDRDGEYGLGRRRRRKNLAGTDFGALGNTIAVRSPNACMPLYRMVL